jgi:hypothetical protein
MRIARLSRSRLNVHVTQRLFRPVGLAHFETSSYGLSPRAVFFRASRLVQFEHSAVL